MSTFSLNVISFQDKYGTWTSCCPQLGIFIKKAPTQADAEKQIMDSMGSAALDARNELISHLGSEGAVYDIYSILCELDLSKSVKAFSETQNEIARKIELIETVNSIGFNECLKQITLDCENRFVQSLSERDLLDYSRYLTGKMVEVSDSDR